MAQVTIGKWGKNLAVRLPNEIARATGLSDGERVEIEANDSAIVIRRAIPAFHAGGTVSREESEAMARAIRRGLRVGTGCWP